MVPLLLASVSDPASDSGPCHDRDEIEEALPHRNVGHVGAPHMVRRLNGQMSNYILSNQRIDERGDYAYKPARFTGLTDFRPKSLQRSVGIFRTYPTRSCKFTVVHVGYGI
jgi:hypothetical protein